MQIPVCLARRDVLNSLPDRIGRNSQSLTDDRESSPAELHRFLGGPMTALKFIERSTGQSISLLDFANHVFPLHKIQSLSLSRFGRGASTEKACLPRFPDAWTVNESVNIAIGPVRDTDPTGNRNSTSGAGWSPPCEASRRFDLNNRCRSQAVLMRGVRRSRSAVHRPRPG